MDIHTPDDDAGNTVSVDVLFVTHAVACPALTSRQADVALPPHFAMAAHGHRPWYKGSSSNGCQHRGSSTSTANNKRCCAQMP
jgi:hypothetical protein